MPRRMTPLGLGALRTAAALLLVDGRALDAAELARIALPWGGVPTTPRTLWIPSLRAAGCRIETVAPKGAGYRLLEIPPDAILEDVLAAAHQLRDEHPTRPWELFGRDAATCRPRETPSSRSSARRSA